MSESMNWLLEGLSWIQHRTRLDIPDWSEQYQGVAFPSKINPV